MSLILPAPETGTDLWHYFTRHHFEVDGFKAWIAEPKIKAPGRPWSWCLEWAEAFVPRQGSLELLDRGFHHVHVNILGTYANEKGLRILDRMYEITQKAGLAKKAVLIGISLGGLYSYRWASRNPEKVAVIYGDAPVCRLDFNIRDFGKPIMEAYGMASEEELRNFRENPIDLLEPIIRAGVALIHVVGQDDLCVKTAENTDVMEKRCIEFGGIMKVIRRNLWGHHPHGLDNRAELLNFIFEHYNLD